MRFPGDADTGRIILAEGPETALALLEPLEARLTGYFYFFNQTNVEMVLKVLNACGVNQHYWVFSAGLTNVDVTMNGADRSIAPRAWARRRPGPRPRRGLR